MRQKLGYSALMSLIVVSACALAQTEIVLEEHTAAGNQMLELAAAVDPDLTPTSDPEPATKPFGLLDNYIGAVRISKGWHGGEDFRVAFGRGAFSVRDGIISLATHPLGNGVGRYGPVEFKDVPLEQTDIAPNLMIPAKITPGRNQKYEITGVYDDGEKLWVTTQQYFDGDRQDANNLSLVGYDRSVDQFYETPGQARSASWIQEIPERWQAELGGTHFMGSSKNIPVNDRHSLGPSLYVFDGTIEGAQAAVPRMLFTMQNPLGSHNVESPVGNPLFNEMSKVRGCFIWVEDYICVGATAALTSPIVYKLRTSGYDAEDPEDYHAYEWRFKLRDIIDAENTWDPKPYYYGKLDFARGMRGAYFDDRKGILYLITYVDETQGRERGPVIYAYQL